MNRAIEAILERRSVRAFEATPVSREDLALIARCGAYAPSALNRQTRRFTIVTKTETIQALCQAMGSALGREGYDMYRPVALLIPSDEKDNPFFKEDLSCALENIFLAAHSLGIGSVWINQLGVCCEHPSVRPLLDALSIPKNHNVLGIAALGYAKADGIRPPTKTNSIHFAE